MRRGGRERKEEERRMRNEVEGLRKENEREEREEGREELPYSTEKAGEGEGSCMTICLNSCRVTSSKINCCLT